METGISPRQFVSVWQTSSSVTEVATKLGMNKSQARLRAFRYKKRGVPLRDFPPVEVPVVDWRELAEFAATLVPGAESSG